MKTNKTKYSFDCSFEQK